MNVEWKISADFQQKKPSVRFK